MKKLALRLPSGNRLTVYAGQRVLSALEEVVNNMNLYKGTRLIQVLEAVYEQGLKDGRREVIEQLDSIKKKTKYLPPGRPKN